MYSNGCVHTYVCLYGCKDTAMYMAAVFNHVIDISRHGQYHDHGITTMKSHSINSVFKTLSNNQKHFKILPQVFKFFCQSGKISYKSGHTAHKSRLKLFKMDFRQKGL